MNKKLHYFDLEQRREIKQAVFADRRRILILLFNKYFPKYQKEFFLPIQDRAIKYKIKNSKVIENFKLSDGLKRRPYWRTLLTNKMKSVKTLTYGVETAGQLAQQIKLFPNLKSIDVVLSALRPNPVQSREKLWQFFFYKACKNIQRLRKLEHLQITQGSKEAKKFLPRVNSNRQVLDSLKTLRFTIDWADASDTEISKLIENNTNLLRNVTSLKLSDRLHSSFHQESFQRLGELCSKISDLSFGFSNRGVIGGLFLSKGLPNESFKVKTSFLQALKGFKAFQNLKTLHICIHDVLTFLKDLELPPSIQDLKLDFDHCLSKEIMLQIDKNFADSLSEEEVSKWFEENSLPLRLYDNFMRLDRLETLQLLWNVMSGKDAFKYQNLLFRSLFKRISSPLKSLAILPRWGYLGGGLPQNSAAQGLSLPRLLDSCKNFSPTLKTLHTCFEKEIPKFDLSAYKNKFSNLSYIKVNAKFPQLQNPDLESPGSLLQHLISLSESVALIELSSSITNDAESLLSILKQMNELKKPNKLEIRLLFSLTL